MIATGVLARTRMEKVTTEQIISALKANVGQLVHVTFMDGESCLVTVVNLDDEGFVSTDQRDFSWATFESVALVAIPGP